MAKPPSAILHLRSSILVFIPYTRARSSTGHRMLPTSTDVTIAVKAKLPANADAVAAFVTQGATDAGVNVLTEPDHRPVRRLLAAKVVRGSAKEIAFDL